MAKTPDYDLMRPEEPPEWEEPKRPVAVWAAIVVVALLLAVAVAAYFWRRDRQPPAPVVTERTETPPPPARPLGGEAAAIDLPPLGETDPLVRELVRQISTNPKVVSWLATDNLIRNFTVVVANVADGPTPAKHLQVLRPSSSFQTIGRGGELYIDPRSYARYDSLAAAAMSLDPTGSARLYATLKPRIEDAYRELGFPNTPFDRTLERALVSLLGTPVVDGQVRVQPRGGFGYEFTSPNLEALTGAQRQLLRTGPDNVRAIQAALRNIALALGIPSERLPAQR
jgi:Protein of unknown function (DUF3014)